MRNIREATLASNRSASWQRTSLCPRRLERAPISFDDRRLARRWFVRRLRLAEVRGEATIMLSVPLARALREIVLTTLGADGSPNRETHRSAS